MNIYNRKSSGEKRLRSEALEKERKKPFRALSKLDLTEKDYDEIFQVLLTLSPDASVSLLSLNTDQAQLVYGDESVVKFFEFKIWVSTNEEDNDLKQRSDMQILLQSVLGGKRFLLVMDDVWRDKQERDRFFNCVSMNGKRGSKILLTTRATKLKDLPHMILQNIFTRLPIRTIAYCKCVSKEWNGLIREPIFAEMHFTRASVHPILRTYEPDFLPNELHLIEAMNTNDLVTPLKLHSKLSPPQLPSIEAFDDSDELGIPQFGIVNSCNGLLCVCTTPFNNPIYVCNPITGDYIMLPKPVLDHETGYYFVDENDEGQLKKTRFVASAFGFSPGANQYKVMRIMDLETDEARYLVIQALTLGSRSWRTLAKLNSWKDVGLRLLRRQNLSRREAPYKHSLCVYLNGRVHWLCNSKSTPVFIGYFNFDSEDLDEILVPIVFDTEQKKAIGNVRLGVLHDCLYLTDVSSYTHFELWVLKDYNDHKSWVKELVFDNLSLNIWPRGLYEPLKYLDNGDLLMFHPSNALVCYNPKEKSFRYFKIRGIDSDFEMVPYIPSLISLKDVIKIEDPWVKILNTRDSVAEPAQWTEYEEFKLVEEDDRAISAAYSNIVEKNKSFRDAFTTRHWA